MDHVSETEPRYLGGFKLLPPVEDPHGVFSNLGHDPRREDYVFDPEWEREHAKQRIADTDMLGIQTAYLTVMASLDASRALANAAMDYIASVSSGDAISKQALRDDEDKLMALAAPFLPDDDGPNV